MGATTVRASQLVAKLLEVRRSAEVYMDSADHAYDFVPPEDPNEVVTMYHATTKERASKLRQHGFQGNVPFPRTEKNYAGTFYRGDRATKLFLFAHREDAEFYSSKHGANAEIVTVQAPFRDLKPDTESMGSAWMLSKAEPGQFL